MPRRPGAKGTDRPTLGGPRKPNIGNLLGDDAPADAPAEAPADVAAGPSRLPEGYLEEGFEEGDIQMSDVGGDDDGDVGDTTMHGIEDSDDESDDSTEAEIVVNVDSLRLGDDTEVAERAGLSVDDVVGAAEYEEAMGIGQDDSEAAPFDDPSDDTPEIQFPSGPGGPGGPDDPDDPSKLIVMPHNVFIELDEFEMALALYADLNGISRQDWDKLRELLSLLKDENGAVLPEIRKLPVELSTLKDRLGKRLPRMNMREMEIPLDIMKMPTLPATLRPDERLKIEAFRAKVKAAEDERKKKGKGKGRPVVVPDEELPKVSMKLTYFDPISVVKNFVSSDIHGQAHRGPALFVDSPTELFHSHAWASSVRTTGGEYAHLWVDGEAKAVIFPGDFIYYRCMDTACYCHQIADDSDDTVNLHIGRVHEVGQECREAEPTFNFDGPGKLTLKIQEGLRQGHAELEGIDILPEHAYDELILTSSLTSIPESYAFAHIAVYTDKTFGETHKDPAEDALSRRPAKKGKPPTVFKKYNTAHVDARTEDQWYFVRRILVDDTLVPLCHTHPIRAELEIEQYGRELYEDFWDRLSSSESRYAKVESFPIITFIDGFGVFRNSYRTLMGMYFTPAALTLEERIRPRSIFPLLLGPHASNFGDVIKGLRTMAYLDQGIDMEINGEQVHVAAFTMCYTGDMPQQAENSGFKGPRAGKFCRCCFAVSGQRAEDPDVLLNFDIVTHGRFHVQTVEMQRMLKELSTSSVADATQYGRQWGVADAKPPLVSISPALDLILSRPLDGAHSEYQGLSQLMHFLLRDGLLNKAARSDYALELRAWKFPPGWQRLQSPIHHLGSYSISDHCRWSIVVPPLLRHWLRSRHLNGLYIKHVQEALPDTDPVDLITETCAAIAKSNSVLMGRKLSADDRENMADIIFNARSLFNQLCLFASKSVGGSAGASARQTPAPVPAGEVGEEIVVGGGFDTGVARGRSLQYLNDTLRPNVHAGVHYPDIANEYGLVLNTTVLTGENQHR